MTEKSWFPWETQRGIGDGEFSFDQNNSNDFFRYFDVNEPTTQGVAIGGGGLNSLEIAGSGAGDEFPLELGTGAAVCYGRYWNDLELSLTTTYPVISTGGRVVLEASWADNVIRAKIIMNTLGTTTPPAITQTVGTTWQIPLASFTLQPTGFFTNFVDERVFMQSVRKVTPRNIESRTRTVFMPAGMSREFLVAGSAINDLQPVFRGGATGIPSYIGCVLNGDGTIYERVAARAFQGYMPTDYDGGDFTIGVKLYTDFSTGIIDLTVGLTAFGCNDTDSGNSTGTNLRTLSGDRVTCVEYLNSSGSTATVSAGDTISIFCQRLSDSVGETTTDDVFFLGGYITYTADS